MSMWAKPYHQFSRVYMARSMFNGMKEFNSCMEIIVVNEEESRRLIFSVDRIADPSPRAIITDWICDALYNFKFPCMVSWRPSYLYTNHNIKCDNSKVIGDEKWLLKDGYKDEIWPYLRDGRVLCGAGWSEWIQFTKLGEAITYLDGRGQASDLGYGLEFLIWSPNHIGRGCIVLKPPKKSLVEFLIQSFMGFSLDAVSIKIRDVSWQGKSKIGVIHQTPGNVLTKEQFFARIQNETTPFNVQDQVDAPAIGPRTPLRMRERLTCEHCKGFHRSGDCLKTPPKSSPPKGILKMATPSPGTFRKASEMFPKRGRRGSNSSEPTPVKRKRVVTYLKKSAPKASEDGASTSQVIPPRKKRGRPAKQKAKEQLAKVVKYEKEEDENDGEILSEGEEEEGEETSFIVQDEEEEMSWPSMEESDEEEDEE